MNTFRWLQDFLSDDDGIVAVEYAVMLALIIGVAIAGIRVLTNASNGMWQNSVNELQNHGF